MRKSILIVVSLTVILLTGFAGYQGYKVWKQRHMLALAIQYQAKSDLRNTILCLQQVLRTNPRNLVAARMMAVACEQTQDSAALLWRARVTELSPRSLPDRLALVRVALAMRDIQTATNALEGVDPAGKNTSEYHEAAAAASIALARYGDAEQHFRDVLLLKPNDPIPQLNLAVMHLHNTNTQVVAEARAILTVLSLNPTNGAIRCMALRELVGEAAQRKQFDQASTLVGQLLQDTNSQFNDKLLQLAVFQAANRPEFKTLLAARQTEAGIDPLKLHALVSWQIERMSSADALAWIKTMPASVQTNQPVALLEAECLESTKDWRGLDAFVVNQNWGDLECLRFAFHSRALQSQELLEASKIDWAQALRTAGVDGTSLTSLLRLAAQWNWRSEAEELLLRICTRYPNEKWAAQSLIESYYSSGQTRALMSFFKTEIKKTPSDIFLKNNLAMIALLLDAQELDPHGLAYEVYQKSPANPGFVSTYAFSLYLQKRSPEAVKVLETLRAADLEQPAIAGYYGMALQATGNKPKARKYLNIALRAQLLPEERKLMSSL